MNELKLPDLMRLSDKLLREAEMSRELGADTDKINELLSQTDEFMKTQFDRINDLKIDEQLTAKEPDNLKAIKELRPSAAALRSKNLPADYEDRLAGAFLSRAAGCTLGSIVEGWPVDDMKLWAKHCGIPFPPLSYFPKNNNIPEKYRCGQSQFQNYTPAHMNGIPCDDDLTYTILGLLALEKYGPNLSVEDIGKIWIDYVPSACTAEDIALQNMKSGVDFRKCGDLQNPYKLWIGALIRSDAWGWVCPGNPEKAAELAYTDAILTHRRTGVYGEMLFAAAQAAAFVVDDTLEAIRIGLNQIPKDCQLAAAIRWALTEVNNLKDYESARAAVDKKFSGMHWVHTINNACLVVFGLALGKNDISKTISQTVAMGYDSDCTTATAGSIVGAVAGKSKLEKYWYESFGDTIYTYIKGHEKLSINDVLNRFQKQAARALN